MQRVDVEERNAKCNICSSGLSAIEHTVYGNRCVFCAEKKHSFGLFGFLAGMYWDYRIYRRMLTFAEHNARDIDLDWHRYVLGILAYVGLNDINLLTGVRAKRNFLRELSETRNITCFVCRSSITRGECKECCFLCEDPCVLRKKQSCMLARIPRYKRILLRELEELRKKKAKKGDV